MAKEIFLSPAALEAMRRFNRAIGTAVIDLNRRLLEARIEYTRRRLEARAIGMESDFDRFLTARSAALNPWPLSDWLRWVHHNPAPKDTDA